MDYKKCFNCGAELPKEAHFCPNCMTKQTEEKEYETYKKRKVRRLLKWLGVVGGCLIIVAIVIISIFLLNDKKTTSKKNHSTENNYEQYLGSWTNDSFSKGHFENMVSLEIVSVKGNEIVFNLTKRVKKKSEYYLYSLEYQKAFLSEGYAMFDYKDKETGETGGGEITLKDKKVFITTEVSKDYEDFDITMDTGFTQDDHPVKGSVFHLEEMTGRFVYVRYSYMNRVKVKDYNPELEYYYAGGGLIAYMHDRVNVDWIIVEYNKLKSPYKYVYRDIDENTTESNFKNICKRPSYVNERRYKHEWRVYDKTYEADLTLNFDKSGRLKELSIMTSVDN